MINELLSRQNIQEFLNKYPSNRWKELITDLFEIGILNLRNSYNRDEFSRKEFSAIINDLENPSPAPYPSPNGNPNYKNPQYENYNYHDSNYTYPKKSSNFNTQKTFNKKYVKENVESYNDNYDYERRKLRLLNLQKRETPSKMDAFYSEKNNFLIGSNLEPKKRTHWEIQNKIFKSKLKR